MHITLSTEKPPERRLRNLFFGLGIDCAVFAAGRNPEAFAARRLVFDVASDREVLELEAVEDARLFTGTMLYFTSSAYMHDVRYTRSELIIDRATDQLVEERDYDRSGRLVGHYWFDAYTVSPPGAGARARVSLAHQGPDPVRTRPGRRRPRDGGAVRFHRGGCVATGSRPEPLSP